MTDVFREVRERLTAREVVDRYGFRPNRAGFICCPFHGEKSPSLKLYPDSGGWHCFGCHAGGSVIDFTARLYGLDAMGAVRRLNTDFGLNLPLDRDMTPEEKREARHRKEVTAAYEVFEDWRWDFINRLNAAIRHANRLRVAAPDKLTDRDCIALKMHSAFENWADTLSSGTPEQQALIFQERGAIARWINQVLRS